ncbi:hypothetical protein [Flectobacillus roseus]|uniref:hypothetical protein n=1 Tax=Flectobacillus roseus TaxID=502259 RepID=UPI0024B73CA3|nr:hypothetical protein [Flectobacillus roseus]MDI9872010.1 hypothetical protein [Flectobacillus roseus]
MKKSVLLKSPQRIMTRKYFLTELNKLMGSYLAEHGFKIKQNCTICKTANDFFCTIDLSFLTYNTIRLSSIHCWIKMVSLEKASTEIYYGHLTKEQIKEQYQMAVTLYGPRKEVEVDIYQDEQISLFVIAFKDYFEKVLLPFFNKYSDIQALSERYQEYDLEYQEGTGYIGDFKYLEKKGFSLGYSHAPSTIGRRVLIMKYINDPKVNDFIKWYQSCIESGQVGLESSRDYYLKVVQKLINWEVPQKYLK